MIEAWRSATADLPGVRAVLDAHEEEPALRTAQVKELAYLASAAGVRVAVLTDPRAASIGRQIRSDARLLQRLAA